MHTHTCMYICIITSAKYIMQTSIVAFLHAMFALSLVAKLYGPQPRFQVL